MSYTKKDQLRSWVYLLSCVFTTIPVSGTFYSFGIFIDIFLKEYDGNNQKAGWISSILLFSAGISSVIGVYLFRYFGLRRVMLASAVLTVFAFVTTPHVPQLEFIFLTFSLAFGIAYGFYDGVSVVVLPQYFDKILGLATGIRYAGNGSGPIIFSYFIPIFFDTVGWHAMMTAFSGLGLMFVAFGLSYKPLPIVEDAESSDAILHTKQDEDANLDLLQVTKSLIKDKRILLILIGIALFSLVEYTPNMFMIQYAKSLEHPISKSKWLLVTFSLCSIVSRVGFGARADYFMRLNKMRILLSTILVIFAILSALCSFTQSLLLMTIYMGAIGMLDGVYWTMLSLTAMEMDCQYYDITFTLMLASTAFGFLVGPPALGWLYDVTGNFHNVLHAVSAGAFTAGIFVLVGALYKPTKPGPYQQMGRSVIATSELKKCSLVVCERETVI